MSLSTATLPVLGLGVFSFLIPASPSVDPVAPANQVCGRRLYLRHCSPCHGDFGLGDGPGAETLDPKPRDFSRERFRLVSTVDGIPTQEDLIEVISRGIVGSAMPPHDHFSQDELAAVANFILVLTMNRRAEIFQELAAEEGEELEWEEAIAKVPLEPGPPVSHPPAHAPTLDLLAEGEAYFQQNCASCHDADGRGRLRTDLLDEQDRPVLARDFQAGIFKGGSRPVDIFRRIRCGMPGTPMPAYELSPREAWGLVHFVESLIDPRAQEQARQRHQLFRPETVQEPLDAHPNAEIWNSVSTQWIALAPLQWTETRVPGFELQLAQDDTTLGLRLSWSDSTPGLAAEGATPDSLTVRFSQEPTPQFFCPGREDETSEYWEWDANSGDFDYEPLGVSVRSIHENGKYEVVILRKLEASPDRVGVGTEPVSIGFEIRNGAGGDPDRSQNLTVWHKLAAHPAGDAR